MNKSELTDNKELLKKRCIEIINIAKEEVRNLSEEEQKEIDSIKEEIAELNEKIVAIETERDDTPTDEKETVEETTDTDEEEVVEPTEETETPTDNKEEIETVEEEENNNNENRNISKQMKKENFKLISAIRAIAENRNVDNVASAVIEAGKEEMRKSGISANGQIVIPTEERADITVANEGADLVEVDMFDIMTPLRNKLVLHSAGAKFLTGLKGDVQVPIMGKGNVSWEGEVVPANDANYTFSSVKLSPKRLTAYVDVSKMFLAQDSLSAENLIREDIVNAIAEKLESTILGTEAGSPTQPEGIFNGVIDTTVTDFKGICDLEAGVEDANVNGNCVYVMSNKAKAALRGMAKGTKSTQLVYEAGEIDGTKAYNTSAVPEKNLAYGDFSNLAIGSWSGIDLTVDPYSKAAEGKVRLVVNAFFDAKVLRKDAIKVAKLA